VWRPSALRGAAPSSRTCSSVRPGKASSRYAEKRSSASYGAVHDARWCCQKPVPQPSAAPGVSLGVGVNVLVAVGVKVLVGVGVGVLVAVGVGVLVGVGVSVLVAVGV
jgi:hypothetical protein